MTLSHTELSQMLETAVVAARLAGQRAMEELRYVARSIKNGTTGGEMVTQADPICQKLIIDRIRENFPDHGFLAEEGTDGKPLKWLPRRRGDLVDHRSHRRHEQLRERISVFFGQHCRLL